MRWIRAICFLLVWSRGHYLRKGVGASFFNKSFFQIFFIFFFLRFLFLLLLLFFLESLGCFKFRILLVIHNLLLVLHHHVCDPTWLLFFLLVSLFLGGHLSLLILDFNICESQWLRRWLFWLQFCSTSCLIIIDLQLFSFLLFLNQFNRCFLLSLFLSLLSYFQLFLSDQFFSFMYNIVF